ncbi:anti-sigma factor [Pandoraea iniqua]|uniref:anti-sigma factor family protein n=1 Tax=Pandoraea iniqua TaxID=2508288 RepID=UPI0012407B5E|nr:zf-HC2 domain-containing protein [Pandoraea iniqua]VVE36788.1 anti-sigma factor [Pandoraea iniqua]
MNEDDIRLLAYVDNELAPAERAEVEAALAASPVLADVVASLHASRLPYRETFAAQSLPPVPQSLSANLDALLRAHAQRQPMGSGAGEGGISGGGIARPAATVANDEPPASSASSNTSAPGRRVRPWWLAAAFAAGVAATAVTMPLLPGVLQKAGLGGAVLTSATTPPPKSPQGVTWVRAAAEYQQLYARDTVASTHVDDGDTARTVADIQRDDKLDIRVPDLKAQGLTFKRVQRLRWQDRALVQMVYLPEKGDPIALCVVKDPRPDQGVAEQHIDRMGVVTWRKGQVGYALIGAPGSADLKAIASALAEGPVTPLYGWLMSPGLSMAAAERPAS